MYSIISFFTGAGFLDLGFEKAGFRVDMVNEYSSDFMDGYRHSRAKLGSPHPKYGLHVGSIEEFEKEEVLRKLEAIVRDIRATGRKVGFVGGPPCPDFSVAGKNAGGEGDNGRLTRTYLDLVRKAKPDFFVFENVEGLWRTKVHRQFYDDRKAELQQDGFVLHDRLVNAIWYGAPQDRRRIFLVGILGGSGTAAFPWEEAMVHDGSVLGLPWPQAENDEFQEDAPREFPEGAGLPQDLTAEHWFRKNDVERHPNQHMAFNPFSDRFWQVQEGDVSKKCFKRLHRHRYSPTAAYGNNEVHLHPYKARRLSVAEALALQSLPKEYELPADMTLSVCFKTIGNGVPFLAANGLARSIQIHLDREAAGHGFVEAAE